jgi:hypothetical protein
MLDPAPPSMRICAAGTGRLRPSSEHPFILTRGILRSGIAGEIFTRIWRADTMAPLGRHGVDDDSSGCLTFRIERVTRAVTIGGFRHAPVWTAARSAWAAVLAGATLALAAQPAWSAECKPHRFRPPYFVKTMGACGFDQTTMSFRGEPAEQARCLMRGMDASRNLAPMPENLPAALARRVGSDTGLPTREVLSTYLSKLDLEWDFAAYLWLPLSHANDDDPNAPVARYFVIHDTSGPNYGHRAFPADVDDTSKINNLAEFKCDDGWGKAHVVINRAGGLLLNHELGIPWRETKFEQAANFSGALKGLFLHVEMIQPRRAAAGRGRRNDAQSPDPAFTAAQYDRLALLYTVASVRARRWLIPAFHAALDAEIPDGHDDPLNFDIESFAQSLEAVVKTLQGPQEIQAADR